MGLSQDNRPTADELGVQRRANLVGRMAAAGLMARNRRFRYPSRPAAPGQGTQTREAALRSILQIGCLLSTLLIPLMGCCAQPSQFFSLSEDDVKAAVLYHLTQFIEWPGENASDVYQICVAGSTATTDALEHLTEGKLVRSHSIRIKPIAGPLEARGCRILFIAACAKLRLQQYLTSVRDSGILTVGEQPGFLDSGGMIELFFQGQRVGLSLSSDAMQRSHLTVSSKLLRLNRRASENIPFEKH